MKFNWEEFKASNNIAVHCKTEEEARDFCKQMHERGMEWIDGETYLSNTRWGSYTNTTHYYPDGYYSSNTYAEENNYTILEWSNYMNEEKENRMNLELNNLTDEQKKQIIELAKKLEQENEVDKLDKKNDWIIFSEEDKVTTMEKYYKPFMQIFFNLGLTAHTKEEAEKIRRRLLVEKELRDWAKKCKEPVDWESGQAKYDIGYDNNTKEIVLDDFCNYTIGNIMFTDNEIGKQAIESIGQERLIRDYFGIDK